MFHQQTVALPPLPRGFHLVTRELVAPLAALARVRVGLAHFLLQHTSASLCLCENADPDVRRDLATWSDRVAPDGAAWMVHDAEGPDDMPAHIKSVVFGTALTLPIRDGALALGTWQGIWLGEHRDHGGSRTVVVTLHGES
ncbi:MAG: YjbQ family protein [Planctomycetes bacterium]|nr:YjbQ family protein [Planctomycetota bacterium]